MARAQVAQPGSFDALDSYLDELNAQIRMNLKNDVDVATTYIEQNLQQFKSIMNKHSVKQAVDEAAFQGMDIEVTKQDTVCNMNCIKTCFKVTENRFEKVEHVLHWCAVPICDCQQDAKNPIRYEYQTNWDQAE